MKNHGYFIAIATGCLSLLNNPLNAAPRMYSNCNRSAITSPKNSGGFHFSEDCKTVYVLPPVIGNMTISSYNPKQSDSSDCVDLEYRNEQFRGAIGSLKRLDMEIATIEQKINKSKNKCALESAKMVKKESAMKIAENEYKNSEILIEKIQKNLSDCDNSICTVEGRSKLEQELESKRKLRNIAMSDYSDAKSEYEEAKIKNDSCVEQLNAKNTELKQEKIAKINLKSELEDRQLAIMKSLRTIEDKMIEQPGGTFSLVFKTEHEKLVNEFIGLNPGKGFIFMKMPMKKAMLSFQNINSGNNKEVSGIHSQYVDGFSSFDTIPKEPSDAPSSEVIIGNAVTGKLTINQLTACEIQNNKRLTPAQMIKRVANLMTSTAVYAYDLEVKRTITGKVSTKKLYCLIKKQSTSNGLFSTSSVNSLIENSDSSFTFDLKITSEDSEISYKDTDQLAMDIRKEMIDRALVRVARVSEPKQIELGNPPKPAAEGLANGLKSCSNFFCSVASFGLNLGSAVFGGTDSTSSTCQDITDTEELNISDQKPVRSYTSQGITLEY